jgi:hypothetical protein
MKRILAWAEIFLILIIAILPVFGTFPYRLNIFLSYEGAYRLYLGQMPFKDFGIPTGFMFWVIPSLFFKIFGPQLITLVKAQVLINVISGLAFRSILKSLSVKEGIRFVCVCLYVFSFSFLNYWPWYNHTVIVYELVGIAFILKFIFSEGYKRRYAYMIAGVLFILCSFFTKQDGGALGYLICTALICYSSYNEKDWKQVVYFVASTVVVGSLFVLPFLKYGFGYWFNHGQPPHSSRFSAMDIADEFFSASQWIKFYTGVIVVLLFIHFKRKGSKAFWANKTLIIFALLALGILAEAAVFQVTSYVPQDNNIFFHSFAIAFILVLVAEYLPVNFESTTTVVICTLAVMLWWSQVYWRYVYKYAEIVLGKKKIDPAVVNKNTYLILPADTTDVPLSEWRGIELPSFKGMLLPGPTVDGIHRIMQMPEMKKPDAKVLNMSELTPLANDLHYALETGSDYPLWFHKGVGMFEKQTQMFCTRIKNNYYDIVLFEYIPYLNNFYPFEVRDTLIQYYKRVDSFTAPRKPSGQAWVEVYVRK